MNNGWITSGIKIRTLLLSNVMHGFDVTGLKVNFRLTRLHSAKKKSRHRVTFSNKCSKSTRNLALEAQIMDKNLFTTEILCLLGVASVS